MNKHPNSQTSTPAKTNPNSFTLKPPKLLFPTLACLLATALLYPFIYQPHLASFLPTQLKDMLYVLLTPLVPALGLFLLHRLLEVIITHRAFRPIHLFSILAIILSVAVFTLAGIIYFWIILYVLATVIFAASLAFQKSRSLTTDPAHFRSSLLSTAVASFILGLINIAITAASAFELISQSLENILFSVVIIVTLPLQLALTFLALAKLTAIKPIFTSSHSASTPTSSPSTTSRPANALPTKPTILLSRFDRFLLDAAFALTLISFTAYLAYLEQMFIEDYSHRQPCCYQPVHYDD